MKPLLISALALAAPFLIAADSIHPANIQFKRQPAQRMVFDYEQAIPLSSINPAKVRDFDLMHPELWHGDDKAHKTAWKIKEGKLIASSEKTATRSFRWGGGFNPFATYDLAISACKGKGSTGIAFRDSTTNDLIFAQVYFADGKPDHITLGLELESKEVINQKWPFPEYARSDDFVLRVQMAVVGMNILVESAGHSTLVGFADFSDHIDIRDTKHMRHYDFGITAELEPDSHVIIDRASGALTPGTGQAECKGVKRQSRFST